jgi:hypothetical protein
MPSIYQMLPRPDDGRVIDPNTGLPVNFYDEQTWQTRNWGLANRDRSSDLKELLPSIASAEVRATIASNHLKKCLIQAKAFHQAIDRPAEPPAGTTLHLIVGTADKTPSVLYADSRRDRLRAAFTAPGDNTTTVRSAVGPMWCGKPVIAWTTIDGVDAEHREMTSDPRFTETMLDLLLDSRRVASPNVHLP